MMHAYASRTGTIRNQLALKEAGWRTLVSPYTAWGLRRQYDLGLLQNVDGFEHCAADNGAWSDYQRGVPFQEDRFREFLRIIGGIADFVVVPDIVMGGEASLMRSMEWIDECLAHTKTVVIPVQNGITPEVMRAFVGPRVGIFVGGDSAWKEATVDEWAALCREQHAWCHVGRVNTKRRISICECAGATSFDGSNATKYSCNVPKLDNFRRQESLLRFQ